MDAYRMCLWLDGKSDRFFFFVVVTLNKGTHMLGWAVIEAVIYEKQKERERRQKISFKDFESFAYICYDDDYDEMQNGSWFTPV